MAKTKYMYRLSNVSKLSRPDLETLSRKVRDCLLVQNLSSVETQQALSITSDALLYVQREFNIRKSRKQITETMQRTNTKKFGTPYFDRAEPDKLTIYRFNQLSDEEQQMWIDKFKEAYIINNLNIPDVAATLNINQDLAVMLSSRIGGKSYELKCLRIQKTSLDKFGTKWPAQSEQVREKMKSTCIKNWGTSCYFSSDECKEKVKAWSMKNYGVDNAFKSKQFQLERRNKMKERYGVEYTAQSKQLMQKMKNTCKERYGCEYYHSSSVSKDNMRRTMLEFNGNSPEVISLIMSKSSLTNYILSLPEEDRFVANIARRLGCDAATLGLYIHEYHGIGDIVYKHEGGYCHSYLEDEIYEFINSLSPAQRQYKKLIYPQEVDIFVPSYNLAIEVNGVYWHSDKFGRDKNYHKDKSLKVEATGSRLYHIFEYEWKNSISQTIIKSQLKNALGVTAKKIYARNCDVRYIKADECRPFMNMNHLQGFRSSSVYMGLFFDNRLVSALTLGKPYFSKGYEWEIYRYCSLIDHVVVGGYSKLFKHFIEDYKPSSVLTYSDYAKGTGKVYQKNGFEFEGITSPNYVWAKEYDVKSRYQCQMKNERQHMENLGYLRVYDCGNSKWSWRPEGQY